MSTAISLPAPATAAVAQRPSRTKLYLLIGLMTFIWALNYIVAKSVARHVPVLPLAALRTVIAGLCVFPVFLLKGEGRWRRQDLPAMLILGLCGVAMNQIFFVMGMGQTSVAHAAIIAAVAPIQVLLLAALRGQEKLNAMKLSGLAVAFSGVGLLQLSKGGGSGATTTGDLFIYASTLLFAGFSVFGKDYTQRLGTFTMTGFAYMLSGLAMLPVVWLTGRHVAWASLAWPVWAGIFYMAAFSSVLAYLIFYYALAWVPASRIAAFSYTQPILASLLGWVLLGESLTLVVIGSAALVLAGVLLVERGR
ncbi:MAG: DMT family transporter [Bryobacteraceae bacterium]|nr:DMT family transporter [Bryobacteraceae bacterium]